jgi:hypothetical protein
MPTVSEVVIGSEKMLSSAQAARMKLVKNDTGTHENGVWTPTFSGQEWNRTLLAQRSTRIPPLQRESSVRPKYIAISNAEARVTNAHKLVPV